MKRTKLNSMFLAAAAAMAGLTMAACADKGAATLVNEGVVDSTATVATADAIEYNGKIVYVQIDSIMRGYGCLLYTSPSPRDGATSRMPSSA